MPNNPKPVPSALVDLEETKQALGITGNDKNFLLIVCINAATAAVERITRRKLKYSESNGLSEGVYTPATTPAMCYRDGTGSPEIFLPQWPIQSLDLVRVQVPFSNSWTTLESSNFIQYPRDGQIIMGSISFPVTPVWLQGPQTCEFTYKAGYDYDNGELPGDIKLFCWQYVQMALSGLKRDPLVQEENLWRVYSYKLADLSKGADALPRQMLGLIMPYRNMVIDTGVQIVAPINPWNSLT